MSELKNNTILKDLSSINDVKDEPTQTDEYRHLYVIIEQEYGQLIPVSIEMLSEARRQMDEFNKKYSSNEKVVAVILGKDIKNLCDQLIQYGADAVIYSDHPGLVYPVNKIYTKVIVQIVTNSTLVKSITPEYAEYFRKPRYMFFAADNLGRHLSSTVLTELESGLASDINKLVIDDLDIRHEHKTKGQTVRYPKILQMYRPDFSGFLWTTILCLDNNNPDIKKDYHPQACSIIPGVFDPLPQKKDRSRAGIILEFHPQFDEQDNKIRILSRKLLKQSLDFSGSKIIVSFGRGIKNSPEENIKLIEKLARLLNAEIGISLPISKNPYNLSENLSSHYITPERVIGTSGQKVEPIIYIAIGVSGATQHIAGMKNSKYIIAINPDENAPIKDFCNVFIKGKMEDIVPIIIEELEKKYTTTNPVIENKKEKVVT